MKHSNISPSSAERFFNCPASNKFLEAHQLPTTEYAKSGNDFHSLCEEAIKTEGKSIADPDVLDFYKKVKELAGVGGMIKSEVFLKSEQIHSEAYGTIDCIVYNPENMSLHIVDIKSGFKYVNVYKNKQLLYYALMTIDKVGSKLQIDKLSLSIFQPSADESWSSWDVSFEELSKFKESLIEAISKVNGNSPKFKVGSWCEHCNKAECKTFQNKLKRSSKMNIAKRQVVNVNNLTNRKLINLLKMKELVSKMFKDAEALLKNRAISGDIIKGHKLVRGFGRRKWNDNLDVDKLKNTFKLQDHEIYDTKIKTVPQIEKIIKTKKGVELSKLSDYSIKPETGIKLVTEDNRSEAISAQVFEDIPTTLLPAIGGAE